jgi:hypothetical protein
MLGQLGVATTLLRGGDDAADEGQDAAGEGQAAKEEWIGGDGHGYSIHKLRGVGAITPGVGQG